MAQFANDECGICLDALAENSIALPCGHRFCSGCLDLWRPKHGSTLLSVLPSKVDRTVKTCPICREPLPPTREMRMLLEHCRGQVERDEANEGTSSGVLRHEIAFLEQQIGESKETIEHSDGEFVELPCSITDWARAHDNKKILDWLGPLPVDARRINARNPKELGWTLVMYATASRNSNLLSCVLQMGADVNAVDATGSSALTTLGIEPAWLDQARLLLEWGAEVMDLPKEECVAGLRWNGNNVALANLIEPELGGRRCELVNLTNCPELNGKTCVVEKYNARRDRYQIRLEGSNKVVLVGPNHLERRDRTPTDCGYYLTFKGDGKKGTFVRHDFASAEACQAYVTELHSKHAAEQRVLQTKPAAENVSVKAKKGKKGGKKGKKGGKKGKKGK